MIMLSLIIKVYMLFNTCMCAFLLVFLKFTITLPPTITFSVSLFDTLISFCMQFFIFYNIISIQREERKE